jgi:hypothetical protein
LLALDCCVDDDYWKMDVGFGTNEKELILVLGHRNAQQRKETKETYQKLYNESLIDRLQSELSGDFRVCHDFMFVSIDLSFSYFVYFDFEKNKKNKQSPILQYITYINRNYVTFSDCLC